MKAVIFDLDGTLIDSVPDIHAAAVKMLAGLDRPPVSLAQATGFVGNGVGRFVERCIAATGGADKAVLAQAHADFRTHYHADPSGLTQPYPGAVAVLEGLRAAGIPMGICTNKPYAPTIAILETLGLTEYFGAVVGGDTLVLKPDPAPLLLCLERMGLGVEGAVFVGDSETDEQTALNAGIPFAFFTGGYRKKPVEAFEAVYRFDHHDGVLGVLGVG